MADARSPRLTGQTAVVTGASRGIGLAVAQALATEGARVVMIARGEDTLRREAAAIGDRAIPIVCDVGDADAAVRAVSAIIATFGHAPTILVNNAGTFPVAPIDALEPTTLAESLATNIIAPFRFIHAFLPEMRARRSGHVITIGSTADRAALAGNAGYAPGKFGARALHEILRLETRGSGIRATLISPGPVDTSLWDPIDPDRREGFTARSEMLQPEAVANAVIYATTQPVTANVDELRLSRA